MASKSTLARSMTKGQIVDGLSGLGKSELVRSVSVSALRDMQSSESKRGRSPSPARKKRSAKGKKRSTKAAKRSTKGKPRAPRGKKRASAGKRAGSTARASSRSPGGTARARSRSPGGTERKKRSTSKKAASRGKRSTRAARKRASTKGKKPSAGKGRGRRGTTKKQKAKSAGRTAGSKKGSTTRGMRWDRQAMPVLSGTNTRVEGMFVGSKAEEEGAYVYPHWHRATWAGKAAFLRALQAAEADVGTVADGDEVNVCVLEAARPAVGKGFFVRDADNISWLDGLSHYVQQHHVKPSKEFYNYIMANFGA
jgi:hypothetical protein